MVDNYEDLRNNCRICLDKSKVLILISNHLNGTENSLENPLISSALSDLMSEEIDNNHPKGICLLCLKNLKLAYHLKLQFKRSQQVLRKYEELIIESYKKDNVFEVYDLETHKTETDGDADEDTCTTDNLTETPFENSVMLSCKRTKNEQETIELNNYKCKSDQTETCILSESTHSLGFKESTEKKHPVVPIKIKLKCNKNRDDVQVRYVDANKYIIERKTAYNVNKNLHDSFSDEEPLNQYESVHIKCPSDENRYAKVGFQEHTLMCKNKKSLTFKCKECHKEFRKIKNLNFHVKLKHRTNPFPCKICGFICKNYNAKQIHMREEHGTGKSFKCEFCNKGFYFNASLLKHKSKHTRETQEVCNICGKTFHYKGALFYHMKIHTNERKYLCIFCGKKFYTSQSLQRHVGTHTGIRRFKCNFCVKSFRSSSERRRHEMVHTGERPHQCDYCDKGFTSRYNLNIHTAAHRGRQQCSLCTGKFLNQKVLQLHVKFKHRV